MDRVLGSNKASKSNSSTNTVKDRSKSIKNRSDYALTTASTSIAQLTSMAIMPPNRLAGVPRVLNIPTVDTESDNLARPVSASTICSDITAVEDAMSHYLNNGPVYGTTVSSLPDGDLKLHFSTGTTHTQLYSYLVFELKSYDLHKVTRLNLSFCTQLTGESLTLLGQEFPSLRVLDLTGCSQFKGEDLPAFTTMLNLEKLCLAGCIGIDKAGFKYLTSLLTKLETLDISSCPQVNDEFLMPLANLVNLKEFILSGCTGFTGAGLAEIGKAGKHSKLRSLTLDQCTQITDADLFKLHTLSHLEELNIGKCTPLTKSGIYKLRRQLKNIKIQSDFTSSQKNRPRDATWQGASPLLKKIRMD